MGAGLRTVNGTGYLTDRRTYREIATNDTDVDAIPETLDTRFDQDGKKVNSGHKQTIVLYVLPDDGETCNVTLYGRSSEELPEGDPSSSSASVTEWSEFDARTAVGNEMIVYASMPATEYKVMVTAISDGGVTIREAHTT